MAEQRKGDHKESKIGNDDDVLHPQAYSGNRQESLSLFPGDYHIHTDTNDFFRVAPFDVVHGDDDIVESTYGGGNRTVGVSNDSTSRGVVVSPVLEHENPAVGLANVRLRSTESLMIYERQEHEMGSNGEFEEDLVNDGWWEKWLVLFSLWKLA